MLESRIFCEETPSTTLPTSMKTGLKRRHADFDSQSNLLLLTEAISSKPHQSWRYQRPGYYDILAMNYEQHTGVPLFDLDILTQNSVFEDLFDSAMPAVSPRIAYHQHFHEDSHENQHQSLSDRDSDPNSSSFILIQSEKPVIPKVIAPVNVEAEESVTPALVDEIMPSKIEKPVAPKVGKVRKPKSSKSRRTRKCSDDSYVVTGKYVTDSHSMPDLSCDVSFDEPGFVIVRRDMFTLKLILRGIPGLSPYDPTFAATIKTHPAFRGCKYPIPNPPTLLSQARDKSYVTSTVPQNTIFIMLLLSVPFFDVLKPGTNSTFIPISSKTGSALITKEAKLIMGHLIGYELGRVTSTVRSVIGRGSFKSHKKSFPKIITDMSTMPLQYLLLKYDVDPCYTCLWREYCEIQFGEDITKPYNREVLQNRLKYIINDRLDRTTVSNSLGLGNIGFGILPK
ncbi:hypothetical protein ADUPG1_010559 [Aduncisulcus paluster]|uniref:Uncharacterized protein n=1 Tax=Aduncisulcus paluster TaxID=2918883 RepID=A0ABQ5JRW3_9EUKA|nr:hypothetical protein ADUPG1_010559 [Aduncisulcus paluster]